MTTVYYVRHAEPNYANHDDSLRELTAKGLIDRELVTAYLIDKKIDLILSSPYKRAIDTVIHYADKSNMQVNIIDDFKERRVDSVWIDDFNSFCMAQWNDFTYKLSDGETLSEVQERNINALNKVLKDNKNKSLVIAGHGTALSTIINYYDNSFGYTDFCSIKNLFPWIVKFTFNDINLIAIEKINVYNI